MQHWPSRVRNDDLIRPKKSGSVILDVANGVPAVVLPAPPAGSAYALLNTSFLNVDGAAAVTLALTEAGALVDGMTTLGAAALSNARTGGLIVSGALTLAVTGAGTSARIGFGFVRMPASRVKPYKLVLTDTLQDIPGIVPPAGFSHRPLWTNPTMPSLVRNHWILNLDNAARSVELQITRAGKAFLFTQANVAANTRNTGASQILMDILPGDEVKARCTVAPAAGTVVLGGAMERVPLLAA